MSRRLSFAVTVVIATAVAAEAQWRDEHPVLRIGMVAGPSPTYTRNAAEPFRLYLEDRLGVRVELFASADYNALISGQLTGRFDATFLTATGFVTANDACGGCLEPLVVPTTVDGESGFHAVLVVTAESPIDAPDDLAGMRLAVSDEDSLAGRLLPLALFAADGVDVDAIDLVPSRNPESAILRLLAGEADAALAWSSLGGARADGYSRGVLRQMVDAGMLEMDAIDIAWTSPPIPYGPFAVMADLPEEMRAEIEAAMIAMATADPDALAAANGALGGGFVAIDVEAFAPLTLLLDGGR